MGMTRRTRAAMRSSMRRTSSTPPSPFKQDPSSITWGSLPFALRMTLNLPLAWAIDCAKPRKLSGIIWASRMFSLLYRLPLASSLLRPRSMMSDGLAYTPTTCTRYPAPWSMRMTSSARLPCLAPRANMMTSLLLAHALSKICALALRQCGLMAAHAVSQIPRLALPFSTRAAYCAWKPRMIMLSRMTALSGSMPNSLATALTTLVFPAHEGPTSTKAEGEAEEQSLETRAARIMASSSSRVSGRSNCLVKSSKLPAPSSRAAITAGSSTKGTSKE
mmetsp:Transcript_45930/g.91029  ORF Transcript_45930/g.91029 Transcript_45930/m.91029 type:complete len:276 (-) Transcript_45930:578-1405(-)